MLYNVIFIIVLNLAISLTPPIDLWGHVGGLAAGIGLAWILGPHWELVLDPYSGNPFVTDRSRLSKRLPLAFLLILGGYLAALWWMVR
jgi:hypothetical protein